MRRGSRIPTGERKTVDEIPQASQVGKHPGGHASPGATAVPFRRGHGRTGCQCRPNGVVVELGIIGCLRNPEFAHPVGFLSFSPHRARPFCEDFGSADRIVVEWIVNMHLGGIHHPVTLRPGDIHAATGLAGSCRMPEGVVFHEIVVHFFMPGIGLGVGIGAIDLRDRHPHADGRAVSPTGDDVAVQVFLPGPHFFASEEGFDLPQLAETVAIPVAGSPGVGIVTQVGVIPDGKDQEDVFLLRICHDSINDRHVGE